MRFIQQDSLQALDVARSAGFSTRDRTVGVMWANSLRRNAMLKEAYEQAAVALRPGQSKRDAQAAFRKKWVEEKYEEVS